MASNSSYPSKRVIWRRSLTWNLVTVAGVALAFTAAARADHNEHNPGAGPPPQQPEAALTRTAQSPLLQEARLTKNTFRYVEREVVEIIQVPYTVTVPYQDIETYYERVQQCGYDDHRVCHNPPPQCGPAGPGRRECHTERICRPSPRGEVCFNHEACRIIPSPPVCHNPPPVCHVERRQECHWVQVPRTRVVTRYRSETHYRSEERRRIVTDAIFDHQWGIEARVQLPQEATLVEGESETILVRLTGTEASPDVEVQIDSPVFSYRVVSKERLGNAILVGLATVPKYQPSDLAEQTILGLVLGPNAQGSQEIRFEDRGVVARVSSGYKAEIFDKELGRWIFSADSEASFGSRLIIIPVSVAISPERDYQVRLTVHREGVVLSAPVDFVKDAHQIGQLSPGPFVDPNGVREFAIEGTEKASVLTFLDATPADSRVETRYEIRLRHRVWGFLWQSTDAQSTLERKNLVPGADGRLRVPLSSFPGLSEGELRRLFDDGDKITLEVRVTRVSPRLRGVSPIRFDKEALVRVNRRS